MFLRGSLEYHHFLRLGRVAGLDPVEIDPAGQLFTFVISAIPFDSLGSCLLVPIDQGFDLFPEKVVDCEFHLAVLGQGIVNGCLWIEWVGVVLAQGE